MPMRFCSSNSPTQGHNLPVERVSCGPDALQLHQPLELGSAAGTCSWTASWLPQGGPPETPAAPRALSRKYHMNHWQSPCKSPHFRCRNLVLSRFLAAPGLVSRTSCRTMQHAFEFLHFKNDLSECQCVHYSQDWCQDFAALTCWLQMASAVSFDCSASCAACDFKLPPTHSQSWKTPKEQNLTESCGTQGHAHCEILERPMGHEWV